jgi:hypothetical protein
MTWTFASMRCAPVPVAWPSLDCEGDQADAATAHVRVVWGYSIEKGVSSHSPGGRGRRSGPDRP